MYDAAEEDRRFARALLLYVEGLRTVGYSDLSLCGISIRNRGLRNFADALFECGIRCTYERPVFSEKGSKPASVHAEDGRGHAITVHSDDDAAKEAAKDPREAWEYLERHGFACERINPNDLAAEVLSAWGDRLPEAVGALISRCKSTGTTIRDLRRANGRNDTRTRPAVEEKLSMLDRVWDMYNMLCMQGDMADYDDMVIQAAELVRAGGPFGRRYTHVLVDEYQDVSPMLVGLLRALRDRTGFKLFCVGDDWQSIYSFNGGDVWQFYDFEEVWKGYGTVSVSRIETTYRCPQTIVDLSGRFVSANPMQQRKDVRGVRDPPFSPAQLLPVNSDRDIPKAIANPNDYAARADLMWAGMLAHNNSCGVGREQDWASHQIEHELSAFYDCAHGAGLAVVLPAWMEYVLPHDPVRLAQFAVRVFGCEMNFANPEDTARQGIEKLCLFFHSLGMPITFEELGAKAKDIPDMVAHRAEKPGGFPFGGFVKIQPADMEAILRLAAGDVLE